VVRKRSTGWLLLAPSLVLMVLAGFIPFVYVTWTAFQRWNLNAVVRDPVFNGLDNVRRLVFDERVLHATRLTLEFAVWVVGSELVIGYGLARLLMRRFPGRQLFRTIHTVPLLVAPIAVGAAWRVLLVPGLGPLPHYLERWFGWHIDIGTSDRTAFAALVIVDIWHWTPFVTLTLLAGLSALPVEPFEAARVDGASAPKTFWYITVPMLKPVLIAVTFIRLMDAMRLVDEAVMLTKGGPGDATRFLGLQLVRIVFENNDYGYGGTVSLFALYITLVVSWALYTVTTGIKRARANGG
jgi:multiple sugar transport system permease protein